MQKPTRGVAEHWSLPCSLPVSQGAGLLTALDRYGNLNADACAKNEDFWALIAQDYPSSPEIINLNYGGISSQPFPVQAAENELSRIINQAPSYYSWFRMEELREHVRTALAEELGAKADEIAIVRNTTEGLNFILYGLALQPGDVVAVTQGAYVNVKETLDALVKLRGIELHWIDEQIAPDDPGDVARHYVEHLPENCKVLVLMHMVNWTGQILPIRAITAAARERGIFVIADGAHACAQFPVDLYDLGIDAWSASLMKWLNAPFGTGVMYLRREHIKRLVPIFPQKNVSEDDIRRFEGQGTRSYAAELAILHAIEYHRALGQDRKTARLRYLTRYWTAKAATIPGFKLHTTLLGEWYGALSLFTLEGWEPEDLVRVLEERYFIHVVPIDWRGIRGVRVSQTFYTKLEELDLLVAALKQLRTAC